ncbi:hypothetical protein FD02_GL000880 [Lacticaseibacillus nasuensis JCM 17158]|uniref:Uncharacterized protein n=1 Tax=Lacticaseibacillus nasuensis JCM 17158 TaxID=1291734 RepID=A0A0R1JT85_9LACO|nr:hypothetical protein FD02_GL000880 [Lacticaseibacillus nasuensis JCM 17158]
MRQDRGRRIQNAKKSGGRQLLTPAAVPARRHSAPAILGSDCTGLIMIMAFGFATAS